MKKHPFTRQVITNIWYYNRDLNHLDRLKKKYRALKIFLDSYIEYKKLVTYPGYLNRKLSIVIENEELIEGINWELQGLELEIERYNERIRWHKKQPIWVPLG